MKKTLKVKVVPFEIAKLLKEMGYDEKIDEFYGYSFPWVAIGGVKMGGKYENHFTSYVAYSNTEWETNMGEFAKSLRFDGKHPPISAPSYDMVIDWLLENHNYFTMVDMVSVGKFRFGIVSSDVGLCNTDEKDYPTRYDAMDAAFKSILKAIKANKNSEITKKFLESIKKEKEDGQAKND